MDPISALSVAAACVQFFKFGLETVKVCQDICDSKDGSTKCNDALKRRAQNVKDLSCEIKSLSLKNPKSEAAITRLTEDCCARTEELLDLLEKIRKSGRKSFFGNAKRTLSVLKEQGTIANLEERLNKSLADLSNALLPEILTRIDNLTMSLEDKVSMVHVDFRKRFTELENSQRAKDSVDSTHHRELRSDIGQLQQNIRTVEETIYTGNDTLRNDISQHFVDYKAYMNDTNSRTELLRSLFFPDITVRQEMIKRPWHDTFKWLFDPPKDHKIVWSDISTWLKSEDAVYWVNGKAGSGKSTLMVHLAGHDQTMTLLKDWAGNRPLYTFSFFFWKAGSDMQKSLIGLMRSLLYQVCKEIPRAAGTCFMKLGLAVGRIPHWTETRLRSAIHAVLCDLSKDCLCIFIDGLDEFEGESDVLMDLVMGIQDFKNIKLCVSSRPETGLVRRLSTCAQLRLQDLNEDDIKTFVSAQLSQYKKNREIQGLVDSIVGKSEGVFLWASVVTQSIKKGLENYDHETLLQRRLAEMPRELNDLFSEMFSKIDPIYYESLASILFLIDAHTRLGLPTLSVARVAAYPNLSKPISGDSFVATCEKAMKQILGQSCGLIDISRRPHDYDGPEVLLHRYPEPFQIDPDRTDYVCLESYIQQAWWISNEEPLNSTLIPRNAPAYAKSLIRYQHMDLNFVHRSAYEFVLSLGSEHELRRHNRYTDIELPSRWLESEFYFLMIVPRSLSDIQEPTTTILNLIAFSRFFDKDDHSYIINRLWQILVWLSGLGYCPLEECLTLFEPVWFWDLYMYRISVHRPLNAPWEYVISRIKPQLAVLAKRPYKVTLFRAIASGAIRTISERVQYGCPEYLTGLALLALTQLLCDADDYRRSVHPAHCISSIYHRPTLSRQTCSSHFVSWQVFACSRECGIVAAIYSGECLFWLRNPPRRRRKHIFADFIEIINALGDLFEIETTRWNCLEIKQPAINHNGSRLVQQHFTSQECYMWAKHARRARIFVQGDFGTILSWTDSMLARLSDARQRRTSWRFIKHKISRRMPRIRLTFGSIAFTDGEVCNKTIRARAYYDLSTPTIMELLHRASIAGFSRGYSAHGAVSSTHFGGSLEHFEQFQKMLIEDLWSNENGQLNAFQQLYALACVRLQLEDIWHIDCDCDERSQTPLFDASYPELGPTYGDDELSAKEWDDSSETSEASVPEYADYPKYSLVELSNVDLKF